MPVLKVSFKAERLAAVPLGIRGPRKKNKACGEAAGRLLSG